MWEDVLIVGITAQIKEGKKPNILIHGKNEEGEQRRWSSFPNSREVEGEQIYSFSGDLHLALASCVAKLRPDFDAYYKAIQKKDFEAVKECREKLYAPTRRAAASFSALNDEITKGGNVKDIKKNADKIMEKLNESLVGRVLRVDWDESQKYPGPAKTLLAIKPSLNDGKRTFGGIDIAELLDEFKSNEPKSIEQQAEDTLKAMADDEEYDRELTGTAPQQKSATAEPKSTATASVASSKQSDDLPF